MHKRAGFTLVELLVAIAIFAVLSALGWKVFDYLIKVKERNAQHEQKLANLQQAYQQILKDSIQIAPLTSNINGEIEPALVLQNERFAFSKIGVTDPLLQGIPAEERIQYQYQADTQRLNRLRSRGLNAATQIQPESSVLLENVEQFQVRVLNPNELTTWPEFAEQQDDLVQKKKLPKGIKINLTVNGVAYEWVFSLLNTDYLEQKQKS
ncbi:type II secretion system minor pseudopilin GspJ [Acinetobacter tandoii]|jgi:general secretion pathway protein J|uniref:Type II secretion system protein J n=1 Tax=Acinetobacter tandoii TaxID=202954 RepID=A0A5N4WC53_9GAMM|nr:MULTISPECIES: type II secretion system minor pseudopilin GspJ [Acinetobacter]AUX87697.1 type II secretion system protein GspJ [Acinetobacter sp. ACNIH2]KAB1854002.1 type II secretion system protein GspJ [Acinetobacter tandoii]UOG19382.1 type II secretion system minor pseudopilin GspJ [Acinetobacter sp. PK01]